MRSAITVNNKAIVSSKGQVVIPRDVRNKLGIHAGHELLFKARADGILEVTPMERSLESFFGRCKQVDEKPISITDMDIAIMQAVSNNNS